MIVIESFRASRIASLLIAHGVAPAMGRLNSMRVDSYAQQGSLYEPIFILGVPRCGSTIFYQALTNYLNVEYIDNLSARWARALPFGVYLSHRKFGTTPHNNFTAVYGKTVGDGRWHAPSECGSFWYRWIPVGQHYVSPSEVTPRMVDGLRHEVNAIQNHWRRPLVFKNLHVGQRLAWVRRAFPQARFIVIERDLEAVTTSILNARRRVGVPATELWSTIPADVRGLAELTEPAMVREQVARLTATMNSDLDTVPGSHLRVVQYSDFSPKLVEDLAAWLGVHHREGGSLPSFRK